MATIFAARPASLDVVASETYSCKITGTISNVSNNTSNLTHPARRRLEADVFAGSTILYAAALPYVQLMGRKGEKRDEASYRERCHKFLWTFASRADKVLARKAARDKQRLIGVEQVCLELRRRAVLAILAAPLRSAQPPSSPSPSHMEAACSASLRAVGNYTQRCGALSATHSTSPNSSLPAFHGTVAPLLEAYIDAGKAVKVRSSREVRSQITSGARRTATKSCYERRSLSHMNDYVDGARRFALRSHSLH